MRYRESEYSTKQSCSYEVRHFYKKVFFNPGLNAKKIETKTDAAVEDISKKVEDVEIENAPTPATPQRFFR